MSKYTPEQVLYIISEYAKEPTRDTVNRLATELGFPYRSIIGKLSKEGVYKRETYKTKIGESPVTKSELVEIITNFLGFSEDELLGLEKSPKNVLKKIEHKLTYSES